jgi:hypothetical protein
MVEGLAATSAGGVGWGRRLRLFDGGAVIRLLNSLGIEEF